MITTKNYAKEHRELIEAAVFRGGFAVVLAFGVFWVVGRFFDEAGWFQTTARWTLYAVLVLVVLTGASEIYTKYTALSDKKRQDHEARRNARASIRQQVRWWIAYLEDEWSWVLDTAEEDRRLWATRRFREIIESWPEDHRKFEAMVQSEEFPTALEEEAGPASRMMKIWQLRTSLYRWARVNVTPVERVTLTLETAHEINLKKFESAKALEDFQKANPNLLLVPGREDDGEAA